MGTAPTVLIVLANVAIVVLLVGMAHFVGWAGPSYAAGFLSGVSVFFTWFRVRNGYWP